MKGVKKPTLCGLKRENQAMMFWYLLRVCPAFAAVWLNAPAFVGVPTLGCEWLAHCCASSASKSMMSSIMVSVFTPSLPICTVGPIIC